MTYLLSWQGTVLSRHRVSGALLSCRVDALPEYADPIEIGIPAHLLQVSFDHYLRNDPAMEPRIIPDGPLQGWELRRAGDGRCLSVSRDGGFLCSPQGCEAVELRATSRPWEWFLPVAEADFQVLRRILRHDWIIRSTGELARSGDTGLGEHWSLRVGSLWLDLRFQLPFDLVSWPHRLTVLRDGWLVEEICLYRPLIYYAAFGDPAIMGQFALSMRSLRTIGGYAGAVAVMSDHAAPNIAALIGEPAVTAHATRDRDLQAPASDTTGHLEHAPSGHPAHRGRYDPTVDDPFARGPEASGCAVLPRDGVDRIAFMSARYTITDWPAAWAFQPILYVDTDIVFEAAVEPVLRAVATSDRLAAPFEPAAPLGSIASVGSGLLQLDGIDPRNRLGFNSGTIGIPNLAAHAGTLRLICRVMANHAHQRGRTTLTHGDQEVANYVAARTGMFDTTLLAGFVRVGGDIDLPHAGRRAIAHFWASPTTQARLEAMGRHMRRLGVTPGA